MKGCESHGELLGGYVLAALEPGEMAEMQLHIESCPRCAREERELSGLPALLDRVEPDDVPPPELSPELEEAVLDRYVRERRAASVDADRGPARRRILAAAATLAALALVAVVVVLVAGGDEESAYARAYLDGSGPGKGTARVTATTAGTAVELEASRLKSDGVYELWCIAVDGRWVSGGTFKAGRDGNASASLTAAVRPGDYHRIVITRRAADAPGSERGVRVLAGKLVY
ncbi:MAG TPA: anti-sigma factor [Thermoleophilaceae bacterium]|nr:anti-sigma factor [Thermoleophilaceae bacterium]